MKITGFGVANFRSFGTTGSMIHDFGRVNVFIGKNNCGKSNVLRFLQFVSGSTRDPNRPANAALDRHRQLADTPRLGRCDQGVDR